MSFGLRTILLLTAVLLFVIALFTDENWSELVALGLAAFAGAFLSDALGLGDRSFGTTDRRDTT